ncbi:MAG: AAA family ATPase [Tunicatimonas sp.]
MEKLLTRSRRLVGQVDTSYIRNPGGKITWDWRLTGILGARGTGKTTLFLQQLATHFSSKEAVYVTLDDIYFTDNRLIDFIEAFRSVGGRYFFVDEVHKYPTWARELKNAYDYYPELFIFFTGSSAIEILRQDVDLSRRAVVYELPGLSLREYLLMRHGLSCGPFTLKNIVQDHVALALDISASFRPLRYLKDYLKAGYYPFFLENEKYYHERLERTIRLVIDTDLNFIDGYDPKNAQKIYQLLYILATNVPFKPNVTKLSEKIGISRATLVQYLHFLEKTRLINSLVSVGKSISTLQKPDKIYLNNPNLAHALASEQINVGSQRETFFLNQVKVNYQVSLPTRGDFYVDSQFTFEVGGKGKNTQQIAQVADSYVAADDLEVGHQNKIPLWLFGFLY